MPPTLQQMHDVLRSNAAIPPALAAGHGAILAQLQSELELAEEETDALRLELCEAKNNRDLLQSQRDAFVALTAAIRRLPAEILLKIFAISGRCGSSSTSKIADLWHSQLYRLAAVCAHWRSIIRGSPTLWAYLSMDGNPYQGAITRTAVPSGLAINLEHDLALTGNVGLRVRLQHYSDLRSSLPTNFLPRNAKHLVHLSVVDMAHPGDFTSLKNAFRVGLPMLASLRLGCSHSVAPGSLAFVCPPSTPRLRRLSVTVSLGSVVPRQILPQLEHLTCTVDGSLEAAIPLMEDVLFSVHFHLTVME